MEGEWDHVLEFVNPLVEEPSYPGMRLMVEKQRYYL